MDNYIPQTTHIIMFQYKRYRVIKNKNSGAYSMWYGNSILVIDRDRGPVMDRFKRIMENFEAIAS
jgi:hypothetical protein